MGSNLNRLRREALLSLGGMMNMSLDVHVRIFADAFDGTSRILHTRTMGLFAEGAQRLSARATEVLGTIVLGGDGGGGGTTWEDGDANNLKRAFTRATSQNRGSRAWRWAMPFVLDCLRRLTCEARAALALMPSSPDCWQGSIAAPGTSSGGRWGVSEAAGVRAIGR